MSNGEIVAVVLAGVLLFIISGVSSFSSAQDDIAERCETIGTFIVEKDGKPQQFECHRVKP